MGQATAWSFRWTERLLLQGRIAGNKANRWCGMCERFRVLRCEMETE